MNWVSIVGFFVGGLLIQLLYWGFGEIEHRARMREIEEDGLRRLVKTFDDKESHDETDRKM
jgi:hypothetical protein